MKKDVVGKKRKREAAACILVSYELLFTFSGRSRSGRCSFSCESVLVTEDNRRDRAILVLKPNPP